MKTRRVNKISKMPEGYIIRGNRAIIAFKKSEHSANQGSQGRPGSSCSAPGTLDDKKLGKNGSQN